MSGIKLNFVDTKMNLIDSVESQIALIDSSYTGLYIEGQDQIFWVESSTNFTIKNCSFTDATKDYFFISTSTAYIMNSIFTGVVDVPRRAAWFSYAKM